MRRRCRQPVAAGPPRTVRMEARVPRRDPRRRRRRARLRAGPLRTERVLGALAAGRGRLPPLHGGSARAAAPPMPRRPTPAGRQRQLPGSRRRVPQLLQRPLVEALKQAQLGDRQAQGQGPLLGVPAMPQPREPQRVPVRQNPRPHPRVGRPKQVAQCEALLGDPQAPQSGKPRAAAAQQHRPCRRRRQHRRP
jgi:hypothetical protein